MRIKKTNISKRVILAGLIVVLAFLIRGQLLLNSDDFHGVSNGRIIRAQLLLNHDLPGGEWYSPVHPPLHLLFLMAGIKILPDPVTAARLISLIFGVLLLFPFYHCVKLLYDDYAALLSTFAVAVYSEHVVYSVIATSETCFHFFLFLALFMLLSALIRKVPGDVLSSGLILGAASLLRYEGLLFIPIFAFMLRKDRKSCGVFLAAALFLPGIWMMINFIHSGDPLDFLTANNFTVPLQFSWIRGQGVSMGVVERALFWPKFLVDSLGVFVSFCGVAGTIHSVFRRKNIFNAVIFCLLLIIYVLGTIQQNLYVQSRYGITLGLFLIPLSIYFLREIMKITGKYATLINAVGSLLIVGSMIPALSRGLSSEILFTPEFAKQTAAYMREHVKPGDRIILDHCGDEKYRDPIKVLSNIAPGQFVLRPYLVSRNGQWQADKGMFFKILREANVSVLIYSPQGDLKNILGLEGEKKPVFVDGFIFSFFGRTGPYLFYRVDRSGGENILQEES